MQLSATAVASQFVLVVSGAILLGAAVMDLKQYKIRNEVILILAGLLLLHAVLSGRWTMLLWNLGFAAMVSAILLYFYSLRFMGGGDLKLLTVALLWVGPSCALNFAVFLLGFILVHVAAAKLKWVGAKTIDNRQLIAFAPSIAAALIAVFISGCLKPI